MVNVYDCILVVYIWLKLLFEKVSSLPHIFQHLGLEHDEKVLPSIGNEVLEAVVTQFNGVDSVQWSGVLKGWRAETGCAARGREVQVRVLEFLFISMLITGTLLSGRAIRSQIAEMQLPIDLEEDVFGDGSNRDTYRQKGGKEAS